MARLTKKQLESIKTKYGVDDIYSFSRYNCYKTDKYSYYLRYVRHIKPNTKEGIWGRSGTLIHETLQDYLEDKIKYEDMIDRYEEGLFELDSEGYKYSKNDKDMNDNISKKYENSIRHFFMNYQDTGYKWLIEKPVLINVRGKIFQGYIDCITKLEDETYLIEDIKSSTIYVGEKKNKEQAQLLLYSKAICDKFNVSIDKVKARWLFAKYVEVVSDLKGKNKDGTYKTKSKNCIRCNWVKESSGNIKKWLETEGYDELEIEDILQTCIEKNSLDDYPNVAKHFKLKDCYVYIDLTQENIDNLCDEIESTINKIEKDTETTKQYLEVIKNSNDKKEIEYFEKLIDELWWVDISQKDMYYYYNLCGYDRKIHKPLDEYYKDCEMFVKGQKNEETKSTNNNEDEFDWD